jgi:CubicO group peptidase (beta-lactamase class C family)
MTQSRPSARARPRPARLHLGFWDAGRDVHRRASLAGPPLLAQPGERWLYSSGSQALGVLAAQAADAPFGEVMRDRILRPLGMHATGFYAADLVSQRAADETGMPAGGDEVLATAQAPG